MSSSFTINHLLEDNETKIDVPFVYLESGFVRLKDSQLISFAAHCTWLLPVANYIIRKPTTQLCVGCRVADPID